MLNQYPRSYEQALRLQSSRYDDGEKCERCRSCSVKFTATRACIPCSRADASVWFNEARENGDPISPIEALDMGFQSYCTPHMCTKGHMGLKTLSGSCYECKTFKSGPRAFARSIGAPTYMPVVKCDRGHLAPRNTNTNVCSACKDEYRVAKPPKPSPPPKELTPSTKMMRDHPNAVIDRETARFLGIKVFRTGRACLRGHTGWRFVTTQACILCKQGK